MHYLLLKGISGVVRPGSTHKMCGRAVQTVQTVRSAATSIGVSKSCGTTSQTEQDGSHGPSGPVKEGDSSIYHKNNVSQPYVQMETAGSKMSQESSMGDSHPYEKEGKDNFNMSPGMSAAVIWMDDGELKMDKKVWGLVTKGGSSKQPLPADSKSRMGMHFSGLMYNARTDTLFSKPTFSRLAQQKRSCVVTLDGYFEWKASPLAGGKGKKQPYFVHRKEGTRIKGMADRGDSGLSSQFLIMAGLWTRVPTGLSEEPFLDTFTILTTEACKQIDWLHHRMPVCIWDMDLVKRWLVDPSPKVHLEIDKAAKSNDEGFTWHQVTTEMSSVKFRGREAIEPKKGPKPVTAFFAKMGGETPPLEVSAKTNPSELNAADIPLEVENQNVAKGRAPSSSAEKRPLASSTGRGLSPGGSVKKAKRSQPEETNKTKGLITSFFKKKE